MSEECRRLHHLLCGLPRLTFPFDSCTIPRNGIYVLFEIGETAHDVDRIVRVGTHTGANQLPSRIKQHFILENKDRSIFRKNVGRALLSRGCDPFLTDWEQDRTTRAARKSCKIDLSKLRNVEQLVTNYMRQQFSLAVFCVADKPERLRIESRMISTISGCEECLPSSGWLGHCSPKHKIRESGLWLVNELYKTPFDVNGIDEFCLALKQL